MVCAVLLLVASLCPVAAGQELIGLRIEGPEEVIENSVTYYKVFAEFDNGEEYEVTLFSDLSVDPGTHAQIGEFGDFETFEVEENVVETIKAKFDFRGRSEIAELDVTIINVGPAGFALDFDGKDDLATVPHSPDLQPTEITVEAWVKGDAVGAWHSIIVTDGGADEQYGGYALQYTWRNNGRVTFAIMDRRDFFVAVADTSPTSRYLGEWHHLAGVYSASGQYASLYVDGELKATVSDLDREIEYNVSDLTIGNNSVRDQDFEGQIDEVRVWNVVRRVSEIRCSMNVRLRGDEPGLVGYWRLDEGGGQEVHDLSPFGHDGFLGVNPGPEGDPSDPTWVLSDAPIEEGVCEPVNCDLIRKFKIKCRGGLLKALVKSELSEGTELTIDNNGELFIMTINRKGKGKLKWKNQTGLHTVFIDDCPEHVKAVNCGS